MPFKINDDGDRIWRPNKRQSDFINIPDTVFEALYGGAAGGGKSELLLLLPILRGFHLHPNFKGIIFRRTFPQLEESLIPRSDEYYKLVGGKYNGTKHVWNFPSGASIRFGYLDKNQDAKDHDTAEYHYLAFDELTAFTEYMYRYMLSRVRTSVPELPVLVRSASNPGNIGHSWVRRRFVEPDRNGNRIIKDLTGGKRIFIPAKLSDNPDLMNSDADYINRLRNLTEAEYRAKAEGDWWAFSGQVFTEFRDKLLPGDPSNAVHVIDPFIIPEWWPRILAVDWGFTAMTYCIWAAVSPDGRVYIYREYSDKKKVVSHWCAEIKRWSQFEKIELAFIDPSSQQNRGDLQSIYEQFAVNTGFNTALADNDRVAGKLLIHEYLRWKKRPVKYVPKEGHRQDQEDQILRLYGVEASRRYKDLFLPEAPEYNLPKLQIFNTCTKLIDVIPTCVYSEKKKEDVAEFPGDDPYDTLRYLVKGVSYYVETSHKLFERQKEVSAIVTAFQQNKDQTSFYRKMEHFEGKNQNLPASHRTRNRSYN